MIDAVDDLYRLFGDRKHVIHREGLLDFLLWAAIQAFQKLAIRVAQFTGMIMFSAKPMSVGDRCFISRAAMLNTVDLTIHRHVIRGIFARTFTSFHNLGTELLERYRKNVLFV